MWEFLKYNLISFALKSLFNTFFLVSILSGRGSWSLTFSIQACMNYLNSSLVKKRAVGVGL